MLLYFNVGHHWYLESQILSEVVLGVKSLRTAGLKEESHVLRVSKAWAN